MRGHVKKTLAHGVSVSIIANPTNLLRCLPAPSHRRHVGCLARFIFTLLFATQLSCYWQILIACDDNAKTAFITFDNFKPFKRHFIRAVYCASNICVFGGLIASLSQAGDLSLLLGRRCRFLCDVLRTSSETAWGASLLSQGRPSLEVNKMIFRNK